MSVETLPKSPKIEEVRANLESIYNMDASPKSSDIVLQKQLNEARVGAGTLVEQVIEGELLEPISNEEVNNENSQIFEKATLVETNVFEGKTKQEQIKIAMAGLTLAENRTILYSLKNDKSFVRRWLSFAKLYNNKFDGSMSDNLDKIARMTDKDFEKLQTQVMDQKKAEVEIVEGEILDEEVKPESQNDQIEGSSKVKNLKRTEQFSKLAGAEIEQNNITKELDDTERLAGDENLINQTQELLNQNGIKGKEFNFWMKNATDEKDPLKVAMTILSHYEKGSSSPVDKFARKLDVVVQKFAADPQSAAQLELSEMYKLYSGESVESRKSPTEIIKELNQIGKYDESKRFTEAYGTVVKEVTSNFYGKEIGEEIKDKSTLKPTSSQR
jgi:hypothetical protein